MANRNTPYTTLSSLIECIKEKRDGIRVFGLHPSSKAYLIASIGKKLDQTIVVITPDSKDAMTFREDIAFFLGEENKSISLTKDQQIYLYPPNKNALPEGEFLLQENTCRRMETLFKLLNGSMPCIIVTTATAFAQKIISPKTLTSHIDYLTQGKEIDREKLIADLLNKGYQHVSLVEGGGEISVRGGILDIFPPLYQKALRIEFVGDEIESIRTFDTVTQRSEDSIAEMIIMPLTESISSSETDSFSDYLPENCTLFIDQPSKINQTDDDPLRIELLEKFQSISFEEIEISFSPDNSTKNIRFTIETNDNIQRELKYSKSSEGGMLSPLINSINDWLDGGMNVSLISPTKREVEQLSELLGNYPLRVNREDDPFCLENQESYVLPKVTIRQGSLSSGFRFPSEGIAFITEDEIFGKKIRRRGIHRKRDGYLIASLGDLQLNDFIVHSTFGIGVYRGLKKLVLDGGIERDFIALEYLGGDKLYLPVERLNIIQKYIGAQGIASRLDKLGGNSWIRTKKKVSESVKKMAGELLKIYASRRIQEGFAFSGRDNYFKEFEAAFKYEETQDQLKAIDNVLDDMESPYPMDRLICGDVGYGKTEVANRAAFKAAMDGKQVVLVAPTTILANQHYQTFSQRFKDYPVIIEVISRFKTKKEQREIIDSVNGGKTDIIIGTHRLLQADVVPKNLGLIIIDEEQRFGVSHKEKLKKLRSTVDVLTLTATPIPRTLNMAMMGIWDLSTIETPPNNRQSIKTYLTEYDEHIIREAILKEINRDGQVFFIHNRVESIESMSQFLTRLVPEARLAIAHGRLKAKQLERVMLDFTGGKYDILLCTTIIESGLDIPTANTIIINRADKFGLADIYQLRGRVGRSKEQAYAYLLTPKGIAITEDSKKRLKAIQEYGELGSSFRLALKDLEIRGAGNILGDSQSGHISAVGYEMYIQLMEKEINRLNGEKTEIEIEPEIELNISALLPEDYIPDTNHRLIAYKKLSSSTTNEELDAIKEELIDLYGVLPVQAGNLLEIIQTKILLKKLMIKRLDFKGREVILSFDKAAKIPPDKMVRIISQNQDKIKLTPDLKLFLSLVNPSPHLILRETRNFLEKFF